MPFLPIVSAQKDGRIRKKTWLIKEVEGQEFIECLKEGNIFLAKT